jgi:hypothetical protein
MEKKQHYVRPCVKVYQVQPQYLLSGSEERMQWSGERPGSAGPGEIDDNSTYDSF